jgi:Thymidylate synthase
VRVYATFTQARQALLDLFEQGSYIVHAPRWQGVDVSKKPEMAMHELLNQDFQVALRPAPLEHWQGDIKPNLPFADVHFEERVGEVPTNPGEAWKIWPWGNNAAKFLEVEGERFSHTYQERFWPKYANEAAVDRDQLPRVGIRYDYADLDDLIKHLVADPLSRQAYLPVWFPEDGTCTGRKPCTLGYHFILRHEYLHVAYFIRSCDFFRHFNDDCYLTVRLLLWMLDRLSSKDPRWNHVRPGFFSFHCVSLHLFRNDFDRLLSSARKKTTPPL